MDKCIYGSCKSLVVTVKLSEMSSVCDYTNILFLFISVVVPFLYLLQQSLSSFLRSFGCLQALRQIANATTHRRLFHPPRRVMTLHPYLLEASEDLVVLLMPSSCHGKTQ